MDQSAAPRGGWAAAQRAFNTALFDGANEALAAIYSEVRAPRTTIATTPARTQPARSRSPHRSLLALLLHTCSAGDAVSQGSELMQNQFSRT